MGKHVTIHLTPEQRRELTDLIRKGESKARVQLRARVLLLSDHSQGQAKTEAAISSVLLCSATRNTIDIQSPADLDDALIFPILAA